MGVLVLVLEEKEAGPLLVLLRIEEVNVNRSIEAWTTGRDHVDRQHEQRGPPGWMIARQERPA